MNSLKCVIIIINCFSLDLPYLLLPLVVLPPTLGLRNMTGDRFGERLALMSFFSFSGEGDEPPDERCSAEFRRDALKRTIVSR